MNHDELYAAWARALWLDHGLTSEQIEASPLYKHFREFMLYGETTIDGTTFRYK